MLPEHVPHEEVVGGSFRGAKAQDCAKKNFAPTLLY